MNIEPVKGPCCVLLFVQHGGMGIKRAGEYRSDVTDKEWLFVLPYLLLCREGSLQRRHDLRTVFNTLRYVAKTGGQWRYLPNDLPSWFGVMQRWLRAGCFEMLVEDVRSLLHELGGRKGRPTAVVIDSRTLQSTPESGARAGYDGAKRRKRSKVHIAVDTLGHLLALTVTPADQGDREQVAALAEEVQQVTGNNVKPAYADQGYTGPIAAEAAQQHCLCLEVVKQRMAKRGFVLLPRRWVVERSFDWAARFRRLARDYERLETTLKGLHLLAFDVLMLRNLAKTLA
jgi:transposase